MATGSTRDVKMVLSVESLGQENITKLQQALRDLAKTGGQGTDEFAALADQIDRLGDQGAALQSFRTLADETQALSEKQDATAASAKVLAERLDATRIAADQATQAQVKARQELNAGDKDYTAAGNSLRELKAQYKAAQISTDAYNASVLRLVREQNEAKTALIDLREANRQATKAVTEASGAQKKAETAYAGAAKQAEAAAKAVKEQSLALKEAGEAARELGVDTEDLTQSEANLLAVFAKGVQTVDARKQAILEMAEADRLAAIEAKSLSALYQKGEAALQAETLAQRDAAKAVREYTAAKEKIANDNAVWQREAEALVNLTHAQQASVAETRRMVEQQQKLAGINAFEKQAAEAQKMVQAAQYVRFWEDALASADRAQENLIDSTQRVNAAFKQLDVRSLDDVQAEITQTNQAMRTLADQGQLTGNALTVAMERGKVKINELQREARELTGTLTTTDRAAGLLKNSMGQIAAGNLIADGIGYLIGKVKELGRAFIEVTLQTESTRKALTAIYKDTTIAAAQMQFLRSTASAAGVSISGITEDFVRFSAAAKGSNIPIEQSNALFQSLARAASTLGLGAEKTGLALNALGQIASKGVVSMEELRQQLGDAVPGALSLTAKGLGITEAELIKLVESGQLAARDFFPAFTEGLKTMQGEVDGARQGWERFKNVLSLVAIGAEANGALQVLTAGLKLVGGIVGAVAFGVNSLIEALMLLKRTADLVAETLKGNGTEAWASYRAEAEKTTSRVKEQGLALLALVNPSEENLALLEKLAETNRTLAGNTVQTSDALRINTKELAANATQAQATAAGANAMAAANKVLGDSTIPLEAKWAKLDTAMNELAAQQAANVVVSEKLAKATALEGTAAVALAQLRGDEAGILQASATAATNNAAALSKVAAAREAEAAVMKVQADQEAKLAILQDGSAEKRAAQIKGITDKIEKLNTEAEASRNAAEGARIETAERELAIEMYKDNSAAVDALRSARENAERALSYLIDTEKLGLHTKEDVRRAEEDLAKVTRLYKDALGDTTKALDLRTRAQQADLSITNARASVEQRQLERLAEEARQRGDTVQAIYYTVEAKAQEIKQIELAIQIKNLELAADRQAIEIQRLSLEVSDPLYQQKAKELDIRLQIIKAQEIENAGKKEAIAALEKEIENLRLYGDAKGKSTDKTRADTSATDDNTSARERNAAAMEKQAEAERKRLNVDKDGFSLGKDGSRIAAGGNLTTLTGISEFLKSAGVDDTNAKRLATEFSDGKGNIPYFSNPGQMKYGGANSTLSEALLKAAEKITFPGGAVGRAAGTGSADTPAASASPQNNGGTTVTVNIGGRKKTVGVSSQNDANTLVSVLRDLETQSNSAA